MPRLMASIAEGARKGAGSPAGLWKGRGDRTGTGRLSGVEQADPINASSKNKRKTDRVRRKTSRHGGFEWLNGDIFVYGRDLTRRCQVYRRCFKLPCSVCDEDSSKKRHKLPRRYQLLHRRRWRFFPAPRIDDTRRWRRRRALKPTSGRSPRSLVLVPRRAVARAREGSPV